MRTTTATGEINSCPVHVQGGHVKDVDVEGDVKVETPEKGEVSPVYEQSEEDECTPRDAEERNYRERSPSIEAITQPRSAEALYNQIMQSSTLERKK